jgi:hypothetical protein
MADIKEITNRWLARNTKGKGILACGVRYPDQTTFNQTSNSNFAAKALDNSWNCVSSTFQFLKQNKNDVDQMCWVFENYLLYCVVRTDDVCLGIFTSKKEEEQDPALINRMISEFKALRASDRAPKT